MKRIISCLAIISVVFLMSCYDVAYDKDDGAAATGNWWDGLNTEQAVKAMDIKADISSTSKSDTDQAVEVTWAFPHVLDLGCSAWTISVQTTSIIDGTPSVFEVITDGELTRVIADEEVLYTWKGLFCHTYEEKIVTYKVTMKDHTDPANQKEYDNIVSFIVYPNPVTLRITSLASERKSPAELFGYWRSKWYDICRRELNFNVDIEYNLPEEEPLRPWSHVNFKIKSYHSFGVTEHWSNSSYCKVTKEEPTDEEKSSGIKARLKYSFEDLPINKISQEPTGFFDYNDVVFKVEVIQ
ncbi:MAG TPA: hypothetical protein P5120_18230 [Spirochaetota bacterium]|nr:hypothetical protein [Spirochaetota bacterium]HPF07549.1 hypothetical protein [Spirochaetota bacterium]HPJ40898.1 hypothetical protein [Spirochaetota bacterium]HPR39172.1 hypothetical protein [Spirochaetota bacterium]HRX49466.1 hypothetical protein [Spirochaetota bacterium]